MAKRTGSSERWLNRQRRDYFAKQARDQGHVSRAHYKLKQLDERFHLLRGARCVLELGAAPGGWTNYLQDRVSKGHVIAVDPLPVTAGSDTIVIEGCYGEPEVDAAVASAVRRASGDRGLDLVVSDMAPNISGVRAADQAQSMDLADRALEASERWLRPGGHMVVKVFHGEGLDQWVKDLGGFFEKYGLVKPEASRSDSREVFAVARHFRGGSSRGSSGDSSG